MCVTFCDYNSLQLSYSYLRSHVFSSWSLRCESPRVKRFKNVLKCFCCRSRFCSFCAGVVAMCSSPRSILQGPLDRVRRLLNSPLSCCVVLAACRWACHCGFHFKDFKDRVLVTDKEQICCTMGSYDTLHEPKVAFHL